MIFCTKKWKNSIFCVFWVSKQWHDAAFRSCFSHKGNPAGTWFAGAHLPAKHLKFSEEFFIWDFLEKWKWSLNYIITNLASVRSHEILKLGLIAALFFSYLLLLFICMLVLFVPGDDEDSGEGSTQQPCYSYGFWVLPALLGLCLVVMAGFYLNSGECFCSYFTESEPWCPIHLLSFYIYNTDSIYCVFLCRDI